MVSTVAAGSVLLATPRPRFTLKRSQLLPPDPKPPKTFHDFIQTPMFPRCCLKVRESRNMNLVARSTVVGPDKNNNCGRKRDYCRRPVVQNLSKITSSIDESSGKKNFVMRFAESIRSFVFGDGNPNKGVHEENRWKLIEQYITSTRGVVAAEEFAPYLDGLENISGKLEINEEKFMLPVLKRYEGHPITHEDGYVLYRFKSLLPKDDEELANPNLGEHKFFMEKKWQFSKTSLFERVKVVLFGVILREALSYLTREWLLMQSGGVKLWAAVLLQICVISFFALIPLFRFMLIGFFYLYKNVGIEKRNRARRQAAEALESPDLLLGRKILSARNLAGVVNL